MEARRADCNSGYVMNTARSLTFLWTPLSLVVGVVLLAATVLLGFMSWRRSGFSRATGLLEGLRLAVVALVVLTLNQPEWLEQFQPDEQPTIVVLNDVSRSMQTRDVINEERPADPPQTRQQWIQPVLRAEAWEPLSAEWKVVFEPFSSKEGDQGTDLHTPLLKTLESHRNLRAVVLLSDGDWNMNDSPARAASRLRLKDVPVFAVAAGSETRLPDVELVRVDVPTFGVVGKPLRIPFVIDSALPRDHAVTVTLTTNTGETVSKALTVPGMDQLEEAIVWRPTQIGDFELTLDVPAHEQELVEENNTSTVPIAIREEALKVLLVESFPRWEYRYLRNALDRDPGVDVSCLLFHPGLTKVGGGKGYIQAFPDSLEELAQYDVVFLGDVGLGEGQLTAEQCRLIKGLIQSQASGLILMPGMRGGHVSLAGTDLDELYPVVLDAAQPHGWGSRLPAQFELTETGRRSLLTKLEDDEEENARRWQTLPGFQWHAAVLRARAGSEVLATHKNESNQFGRVPLLVTKTYGTGKVLFMGTDGAWRWREGVEDAYHYRFWGQVARWMAYQRSMAQGDLMRLFYSPDRPQVGDVVTLNANVMSTGGEPLSTGTVMVQIVAPSGNTESIRLIPSGDEWGLFTSSFTPEEPGDYQLTLTSRENGSALETTLSVQGTSRERLGRPARFDVLEEITSITRGKVATVDDLGGLITEIKALPEPQPIVRRLRLWCHPVWGGFLVILLGVFWTGRKMIGVI